MNCVCHQQNFHKSLQYTIENWMDFVLSSGVCVYGLSTRFSLWQRNKKRFTTYLQSNKTQNQYKTIEFVLHIFFLSFSSWCLRNVYMGKNRHITHYMHFYWFSCRFFPFFVSLYLNSSQKEIFFCFQLLKLKLNQFTANDDVYFFTFDRCKAEKKNWFVKKNASFALLEMN